MKNLKLIITFFAVEIIVLWQCIACVKANVILAESFQEVMSVINEQDLHETYRDACLSENHVEIDDVSNNCIETNGSSESIIDLHDLIFENDGGTISDNSVLDDEILEEGTLDENGNNLDDENNNDPNVTVSANYVNPDASAQTITVNTVEKLKGSLGSNRTIILEDGLYTIEDTLYLEDFNEITIKAKNFGKVEILNNSLDTPVLSIGNCKNVVISGLIMGHNGIADVGCAGEGLVVCAYDCNNIQIDKCDMYGCGVIGMGLYRVKSCLVNESVIRDCEYSAIQADNTDATIKNCYITANGYLIKNIQDLGECAGYRGCTVDTDDWDPQHNGYSNIKFDNCKFYNEHNPYLKHVSNGAKITFSSCEFSNNMFDKKTPQTYGVCLNGLTWEVVNSVLRVGYTINTSEGKTINNSASEVLPYSQSSLPWKDVNYSKYDVRNGINYATGLFKGEKVSGGSDTPGVDYKIDYILNGGINNPDNPKFYSNGNAKIKLKPATKSGYKFEGWYLQYINSKFKKKTSEIKKNSKGNITLYAKWSKPINYSISYNLNGGKLKGQLKKYTVEMDDYRLPIPTRKGYVFGGWFLNKNFDGNAVTKIVTSEAKNIKLFACWTYQIRYDGNAADVSGTMNSTYCQYGKSVQLAKNQFTRPGYVFKGWSTKPNGKGKKYKDGQSIKSNPVTTGDQVITLYANWGGNTYTVIFEPNGGTGKMGSMKNCVYGKTYSLTKNKFKYVGAEFVGWNTEFDGTGRFYANSATISNLTQDNKVCITLYAQWTIQTYRITYQNVDGSINANPGEYTVFDVPIELKAAEKQGFDFGGWYTDNKLKKKAKSPAITRTTLGNKTFFAKFTEKTCTINFDANGGSGKMAKQTLKYSENLPSNKFSKGDISFIGWNTKADGSGNGYEENAPISSIIDNEGNSLTLYAQWNRRDDIGRKIKIATEAEWNKWKGSEKIVSGSYSKIKLSQYNYSENGYPYGNNEWCAYFVSRCLINAGVVEEKYTSGSSTTLVTGLIANGRAEYASNPLPGDIIAYYSGSGSNKSYKHVAIADEMVDGHLMSYQGNVAYGSYTSFSTTHWVYCDAKEYGSNKYKQEYIRIK